MINGMFVLSVPEQIFLSWAQIKEGTSLQNNTT